MIASAGGGDNIVGIEIRPFVTKEGLGTFRQIRDEAKATEKTAIQAAKESSRQQIQSLRETEREADRLHSRNRARQLERARDSRRTADEAAKDSARSVAMQEREEQRQHDRMRSRQLERARDSRRAHETEAREAERSSARQAAATARAHSGYLRAGQGVTQLGRSLILLGGQSEGIEKLAQHLAAFEGVVQGAKGIRNIATGLRGAAAGAGAGGMAGSALSVVGRAGPVGGLALAGTAVIAGTIAIFNKDFRRGLLALVGAVDDGSARVKAAMDRSARRLAMEDLQRQRQENNDALRSTRGSAFTANVEARLENTPTDQRANVAAYNVGIARQYGPEAELSALQMAKREVQARIELTRTQKREEADRVRESLQGLEQERDKQQGIAASLRQKIAGGKESFASLSPIEQARVKRDAQRFNAGEDIGFGATQRLAGMGIIDQSAVAKSAQKSIDRAGAGGLFAGAESQAATAEANAAKLGREIVSNIFAANEIEQSAEKIADSFGEVLERFSSRIEQLINQRGREAIDKQLGTHRRNEVDISGKERQLQTAGGG